MNDEATCAHCNRPIDETLDTPDGRHPCPNCGSTARKFTAAVVDSLQLTDHGMVTTHRNGDLVGFAETVGRARITHTDLKVDGSVEFSIKGMPSHGEEGTLEACQTLVAHLNSQGATWVTPREMTTGVPHTDVEAVDVSGIGSMLIQVVRALPVRSVWEELSLHGESVRDAEAIEIAGHMKRAIDKKASVIPEASRKHMVLVLNARETPAVCLSVVRESLLAAGPPGWLRATGFHQIWIVGLNQSLVFRIDDRY